MTLSFGVYQLTVCLLCDNYCILPHKKKPFLLLLLATPGLGTVADTLVTLRGPQQPQGGSAGGKLSGTFSNPLTFAYISFELWSFFCMDISMYYLSNSFLQEIRSLFCY